MAAIRILRGCFVAGQPLLTGNTYRVPTDLSDRDANSIVRMGKAEFVDVPEATAKKSRQPKPASPAVDD